MKKITTWVCLYALVFGFVITPAYAFGTSTPSGFGSVLSNIYNGASSVGRSALSSGLVATSAGDILVQPSGLRIPVTVAATVARGRIVGAAAACLSGLGSVIGCVATAAFAAGLVADGYGLVKCGLGYCKPATIPADPNKSVFASSDGKIVADTIDAACNSIALATTVAPFDTSIAYYYDGSYGAMVGGQCRKFFHYKPQYYNGYDTAAVSTPTQTTCANATCPPLVDPNSPAVPAKADELAPAIDKTAQAADLQKIYDYLKQDQSNYARSTLNPATDVTPDTTPVTVTSPPTVMGQSVVTSTKTTTNPDGTTSTEVTKNQTTITPTAIGSTIGDVAMSYPSSTTVTVTNTNNTTGAATTTSTVNNGTESATPAPEDKGPKECGTPGKPKCQIDETGTPDGKTAFDTAKTQLETASKAASDQVTSAASPTGKDTSWHFSFNLPSQCSSFPMFLNVVIDFCRFQPMIHDLMSLVWVSTTVFVVIGMFGRAQRGTA